MLTSLLPTLGIANTLGLSAFVLAYLLTYWSLTLLPRWGMVDQPDYQRHIHTRAVPRGGGIGMIVAFITVTLAFFGLAPLPSDTAFHAILKLLVPMAILLPLGILDDKFGLSPKTKFLFQTAAAILAWTLGFRLDNLFGATLPPWSSFILTVVWVVGFINAFNMIDGVDGLASGVGAISAVCMAVVAFSKGEYAFAVLLVTFMWFSSPVSTHFLGQVEYYTNPHLYRKVERLGGEHGPKDSLSSEREERGGEAE